MMGLWLRYQCLMCLVILAVIYVPVQSQRLSSTNISVISRRLAEGATHSWEYGTRAQALLELNAPLYSVFSPTPIPPTDIPVDLMGPLSDVFIIAHNVVASRPTSNGNIVGPQPLINDGAAGDPASIAVSVLLANWTGQGHVNGLDYAGAAQDQLDFLLTEVPRTNDGAISHRTDQTQLWSDSVYMVPPFLAYYGALTGNLTLLQEAYDQIKLYRKYLLDKSTNNVWRHIQNGEYGIDNGHWSTGNAWAAAGMLRVLSTIKQSEFGRSMTSQQMDLANWIQEIHDGMYPYLDSSGLFYNYVDDPSTFLDASSTALLASTVYRLSLLWGVHKHLPTAELCRRTLSAPTASVVDVSSVPAPTSPLPFASSVSSSTSGMRHFTRDGWLTPVVDPYSVARQGQASPEGQAFILLMQAAWRDWVDNGAQGANVAQGVNGVQGANGAVDTLPPSSSRIVVQAVAAGILPFAVGVLPCSECV